MRAVIALALLFLSAAPLARAAAALVPDPHACCPDRPAPEAPAPCQQVAPTSCCLEIGVPGTPSAAPDFAAPLLALPAAFAGPIEPPSPRLTLDSRVDPPPLPPLAQSGVLLL